MSLIFLDWKSPPDVEDNTLSISESETKLDNIWEYITEDDIRRFCKEGFMKCMIPVMHLLLMIFVWTVSLKYGSVLMPSVLTAIIIILYLFNYIEDHAIKYAISDIIHIRHHLNKNNKTDTGNVNKTDPNNGKDVKNSQLRPDSGQSRINYFNYSNNYYIQTIDEICEIDETPTTTYPNRAMIGF